jgi:hypothetical protein
MQIGGGIIMEDFVYCKDCKHYQKVTEYCKDGTNQVKMTCVNSCGLPRDYIVTEYDYCSRSEQKTD